MAVQSVLGGELAWVADDSPGASAILAHHWPTVPNLGDITAVDWTAVEPVDVLCAGFPCQDVSAAGLRAGMRDGNRSGLWSYVAEAIAALRPPLVYIENVRGLLSAGADCDLEPCPGCLGDEPDQPALRACGAVCGDLASLGFDAEWTTLPASAVGASHGRPRVFVLAWPRFVPSVALGVAPPDAEGDGRDERWTQPARLIGGPHAPVRCTATPAHTADNGFERGGTTVTEDRTCGPSSLVLLPTPTSNLGSNGGSQHPDKRRAGGAFGPAPRRDREPVDALLLTPVVTDARGARNATSGRKPGSKHHDGVTLSDAITLSPGAAVRPSLDTLAPLLPTPAVADANGTRANRGGDRSDELLLNGVARSVTGESADVDWGVYEPAIRRWEALTRPAPAPTEPGKSGKPRLAPAFSEWLMGLPAGHVTAVPGLSRNQQLTAIGNGVVPQQAAHALRLLLETVRREVAA